MVRQLRATTAGELVWLATLTLAVCLHVGAVTSAFLQPQLIDFAAFIDNIRAWAQGRPYSAAARDPNTPHMLLVFWPLVGLPLRLALAIWLFVSYLCAALVLRVIATETRLRMSAPAWITLIALLLASTPALDMVADGNMIWLLWPLFTVAWRLDRGGRPFASGLLLGALMSVKPFVGVWLVYWALRDSWRAFLGGVLALTVTLGLGLAVTGLETWISWYHMLERITWYDRGHNASVIGFAARVGGDPYAALGIVLAAIVGGTAAWSLARARRDIDRDWLFVFLTAMLLSPLGWRYYYCFALGPAVALLQRGRSLSRVQILLGAALLFCPAPHLPRSSALVSATAGSLAFWPLFCAWLTMVRTPPR